MITPLELLEFELNKYVKAKRKSCEAYHLNKITSSVHKMHITNLNPLIKTYSEAVDILKKGLG